MDIICIGHSGFLVSLPGYNLIFDYFTDKTGVIKPGVFAEKKAVVFVSHSHGDHYNTEIFDWAKHGDIIYVLDIDCKTPESDKIIKMREGENISLYDNKINVRAFGSTDEGLSFFVDVGGKVLFHSGDLNDWYWEDDYTPERLQTSEENYLKIIRQLAGLQIDVAFVPRDPRLGKHAARAINHFRDIVNPDKIIPMHFPGNDGAVY